MRWLHGEVKTPPLSLEARREMGLLLRELQDGEMLAMPHSRPMPGVGPRCHELRVNDEPKDSSWPTTKNAKDAKKGTWERDGHHARVAGARAPADAATGSPLKK